MPIYAYRCSACGHAKDVLQKMADPLLTTCPACGAEAFSKQVTAAGFQLKGSGWYVTDFKGGGNGTSAPAVSGAAAGVADGGAKPSGDGGGGSTPAAGGGGSAGDAGSTGGSSSAAAGCGGSCACH